VERLSFGSIEEQRLDVATTMMKEWILSSIKWWVP
jgi:hypothetical protein